MAFQRGRTPTKEWLRLQISLLGFILSPHPQKGLSGKDSLLSLQLGAQMSPHLPSLALHWPVLGLPQLKELRFLPHSTVRCPGAKASEHLLPFEHIRSKQLLPQFLQPKGSRAPTEHVPCGSLLSGRLLLPPLLHRELGNRVRIEVSRAVGTQPQGQAEMSRTHGRGDFTNDLCLCWAAQPQGTAPGGLRQANTCSTDSQNRATHRYLPFLGQSHFSSYSCALANRQLALEPDQDPTATDLL